MPLGDVDPNIRRRLRSSLTTTEATPPRAVKRPWGRPPILSGLVELLQQRLLKELRPRGRPWIPPTIYEPSIETLRPLGRWRIPPTTDEPPIKPLRPRGRPTTLLIYQDLDSDCEVSLRPSNYAPLLVLYFNTYFRGFISAFEPLAGPHSLGLIEHKYKFCTANYFIQEAVAPNQECLMFESCCKKGDAYLEPLKGVPPYLQSLYKS